MKADSSDGLMLPDRRLATLKGLFAFRRRPAPAPDGRGAVSGEIVQHMHSPRLAPHAASRTESANLSLIFVTFLFGLIADQHGGLAGQLAVGVWTWAVFFRLLQAAPQAWRLPFWVCITWATAGEIFLSLVWGLYTYRLGNIPFFIPPGHVLLFYTGLVLAPRMPRAFVASVPVLAVAYAAFAAINGFDTVSVLLTVLFVVCMLQAEGRRLYAVMFVASLLVELYGTWMGNWIWHPEVPYFGFNSANPPLAAGAFYCALDVLVGLTVRGMRRLSEGRSASHDAARPARGVGTGMAAHMREKT